MHQPAAALIVAAGRGRRAGQGLPKQYRTLNGSPVLRRTVAAFSRHPRIDLVTVVIHPDDRPLYDDAVSGLDKLAPPVAGGSERQESVRLGLEALSQAGMSSVLIHDAARPFVSEELIDRMLDAVNEHDMGAIPALPVVDTLKRGHSHIQATVDRTELWRAQTPQAFALEKILTAHQAVKEQALTDDAAVMEAAGFKVRLVAGLEENVKLTTAADFQKAERDTMAGLTDIRTGTGFDVHRFEPGDHCWLCGIKVPHTAKLKGHSDADVGLHALTDAILGALADGDIGTHFPPSDPQWQGAASDQFLAHAAQLVRDKGGQIGHCDVTLICERPKIGPHKIAMRQRIAEIIDIDAGRVSVKATTSERLGFTGREEGIAAQAAATIRLPE